MTVRGFTSQLEDSAGRSIDSDAPAGLRQELIDLIWHIGSFTPARVDPDENLYFVIEQSLGFQATGNPMSGRRQRAGRDVAAAEWPRVYDLIVRLWHEFERVSLHEHYRTGVNSILAGYHVVWDLGEDGQLHRALPPAAQVQIEAAFRELSQPRFAAALPLFREAMNAYDDRPQRGREACASIFDALESVAKEVFRMPTATFGNVLAEARKQQSMANETISALQKLYDMANAHFRHGMTTPFPLKPAEVDFVLGSSIAGTLLFIRL